MDYPRTTKADIENDKAVDLIGYVLDHQSFDDGDQRFRIEDIEGETFELKVWDGDLDGIEIKTETWVHLQNALGDVYKGNTGLGSNYGKIQLDYLDAPPEFVERPDDSADADQELSQGGFVLIDIETISVVPEEQFDFENSDHLELLCTGVGHTSDLNAKRSSQVLFRGESEAPAEADLLRRLCEYVEERDPAHVVLFKGDFDKRHLVGRAKRLTEIDSGLADRVQRIFSRDVLNIDPWGSLEDNADVPPTYWDIYNHTLDPASWRETHPRHEGSVDRRDVVNTDIPYFGQRYLKLCDQGDEQSTEGRALRELLRHYTVTDIDPLFDLIE